MYTTFHVTRKLLLYAPDTACFHKKREIPRKLNLRNPIQIKFRVIKNVDIRKFRISNITPNLIFVFNNIVAIFVLLSYMNM
jgi:hypothetical protein